MSARFDVMPPRPAPWWWVAMALIGGLLWSVVVLAALLVWAVFSGGSEG